MARQSKGTAVSKKSQTAVGEFVVHEEDYEGLDHYGYSTDAKDHILPTLSILQDNSGEVKKRHDRHREGAEPGMLIMRSLDRVHDTEADGPLYFQPCIYRHVWIEWEGEPGEGRSVGSFPYDEPPLDARKSPDPNNDKREKVTRSNGNRLVDTREHYGYLLEPEGGSTMVRISMSGTNHNVSKTLSTFLDKIRLPDGRKAIGPYRKLEIRTEFQQRGAQSWYRFKITDGGWLLDREQQVIGVKLMKEFDEFMKTVDIVDIEEGSPADDDSIPV